MIVVVADFTQPQQQSDGEEAAVAEDRSARGHDLDLPDRQEEPLHLQQAGQRIVWRGQAGRVDHTFRK